MGKLTKSQLLSQRGDLSPFLIHLTRDGDLKLWKEIYKTPKDQVRQVTAERSLKKILQNSQIKALSPFGYFNYKVPYKKGEQIKNPDSKVHRHWLRAVCFTETPLDHVNLQMQNIWGRQFHFAQYGLAFKEPVVREKGGNPVFYTQTTNEPIRAAFDKIATNPIASLFQPVMPLIEGFGPPWYSQIHGPQEIDFRWEREWRIVGDFKFSLSDVAFGFCPIDKIKYLEEAIGNVFPFVDPLDDLNTNKKKLRKWPHLENVK